MQYTLRNMQVPSDTDKPSYSGIISSSKGDAFYYNSMNAPYAILLEEFHPNRKQDYFHMTISTPVDGFESIMTQDEAMPILKKTRLHQHSYYELLYVLEGEMYQIIESQRHFYLPGSCCFLNLNVRHTEEFSTDFRAVFLELPYSFLEDLFNKSQTLYFNEEHLHKISHIHSFFNAYSEPGKENEKAYIDFIPKDITDNIHVSVKDLFHTIYETTMHPRIGSTLYIKYLVLNLFDILENEEYYQTTPIQLGTETEAQIFNQISRIMEKTNGRTTRSELEAKLNYSGDYINKIVKKYSGLSIFNFGMTFCMRKAAEMLLNRSQSVAEIAVELGFKNKAHFYKIFNQTYGMTPNEYRTAWAKTKE